MLLQNSLPYLVTIKTFIQLLEPEIYEFYSISFCPIFLIFNPLVSSKNVTYRTSALVQTSVVSPLDCYHSLLTRLPVSQIAIHTVHSLHNSQVVFEEHIKDHVSAESTEQLPILFTTKTEFATWVCRSPCNRTSFNL